MNSHIKTHTNKIWNKYITTLFNEWINNLMQL